MNITLASLIVLALAVIAGLWMFGLRMRQAGESKVEAEVAKGTVDVLKRMDETGAKGPHTEEDVVDRLRRGGF